MSRTIVGMMLLLFLLLSTVRWTARQYAGKPSDAKPPFGLTQLKGTDTSRLMGSPDVLAPMEFERAFPALRKIPRPVQVTHAGDGGKRLLVATQTGVVYVFANRRDVKQPAEFLRMGAVVANPGGDNGLMGLAFHPRFRDNGQFFVVYTTRKRPQHTIVSRLRVSKTNPNRANRKSEEVLLRIRQPFADHNAACLQFGPDGYLYIALGDGGWNRKNNNAQDLSTLLGAMLRIDVDRPANGMKYGIPRDNPFVGKKGARGEIWAYGLRAPWRFSFDRLTGTCWLGDNGQTEYEEIDVIVRGGNYGWNRWEGLHPFDPKSVSDRGRPVRKPNAKRKPESGHKHGFTDPILEYYHDRGISVVGGYVYRGRRLPELYGAYLYADWGNGNVWGLRWDGKQAKANRLIARTRLKITSFGEDEAGEVYFTAFDGHIYRFRKSARVAVKTLFPTKLSQTGLFASVKDLKPTAGLIPYSVNVPLWSDYSSKERFIALPPGKKVVFRDDDSWEFPVGTVFVKTFLLEMTRGKPESRRRLETRLLVHTPREWAGYTYLWNDDETEAFLAAGAATKTYRVTTADGIENQHWYFPSRSDCFLCHTRQSGFVLGLRTRQLNRRHNYGKVVDNQLRSLDHIGFFTKPLPKPPPELPAFPDWRLGKAEPGKLARAYLDVNCAMCHTPPDYTSIDLRLRTPLERMGLLDRDPEKPRVGPADSKLIVPGEPNRSELLLRMKSRGAGRMPNLATSMVDHAACTVVGRWIRSMGTTEK